MLVTEKRNVALPNPVNVALLLAIEALPLTTLHTPSPLVPTPAKVNSVPPSTSHLVSSEPADDVGFGLTVNVTSLLEAVHTPLEIVQRNVTLLPAATPVTVDVAEDGVVIAALPDTIDQTPVPTVGTLPASVKFPLPQFVKLDPATEVVGNLLMVRIIASVAEPQVPTTFVVKVKVTLPLAISPTDGVYTAFLLAELLKLPDPLLVQVPLEALPPKSPESDTVFPSQIV